jgi:hypothetical protein
MDCGNAILTNTQTNKQTNKQKNQFYRLEGEGSGVIAAAWISCFWLKSHFFHAYSTALTSNKPLAVSVP